MIATHEVASASHVCGSADILNIGKASWDDDNSASTRPPSPIGDHAEDESRSTGSVVVCELGDSSGSAPDHKQFEQPSVAEALFRARPPPGAASARFHRHQQQAIWLILAGPAAQALLRMRKANQSIPTCTAESLPNPPQVTFVTNRDAVPNFVPRVGGRRLPSIRALMAASSTPNPQAAPMNTVIRASVQKTQFKPEVSADPVMYGPEFVPRRPLQSVVLARHAAIKAALGRAAVQAVWPHRVWK